VAENQTALAESGADKIPVLEQDRLSDITLESQASRLIYFGNALYIQGRYEEAIKHYQRFSQSHIGDVELFVKFSDCWRNLNQITAAIAILEEGIRHYPTAGKLHFELIKISQ